MNNDAANHAWQVNAEADCLFDRHQLEAAMDAMATAISTDLADANPLLLTVMTGGVVLAGQLLTRLDFPLQLDYIHATRYRGETSGGELHWLRHPVFDLAGRHVLIVDDILDEGYTLAAIEAWCAEQGAASVRSAVLVDKNHQRKAVAGMRAAYTGLDTPDRYLFGYGMDYKDYLRNAPGIYAVKGM